MSDRAERMRALSTVLDERMLKYPLFCAEHPFLTQDLRDTLDENAAALAVVEAARESVAWHRSQFDYHTVDRNVGRALARLDALTDGQQR